MKHYGDITKIDGSKVEPVWIVTGGSPCQDLSVAGKRAGLDGERSGLFMEQIRIIKEMRDNDRRKGRADEFIRPRFMVWENVPGAFSSNKGEDFRIVLEETAKVADETVSIPRPSDGKWTPSGVIMGKNFSLCWRTHDAQFWGVPQRRRRIALVADFGGMSAPEILFECESLSGNTEQSREEGQGASASATGSVGAASECLNEQPILLESNQNHATIQTDGVSTALSASMGMGGGYVPMITDKSTVVGIDAYNQAVTGDKSKPLTNKATDSDHIPCVMTSDGEIAGTLDASYYKGCGLRQGRERTYIVDQGGGKSQCAVSEDVTPTLATTHGGEPAVCYGIRSYASNAMKSNNPNSGVYEADTSRTLDNSGAKVLAYGFDQGASRDVGKLFCK